MRILYFYQYFSTPNGAWGTRVYDFASNWVKQGHEVTVVTSVYAKSDLKVKNLIENRNFNGISVKIINIKIDNQQGFFRRIMSFLGYSLISSWFALRIPADVVVASSGPITVGVPGLISKIARRKPFVFEVRDLWPDGAIELGILKSKFLMKFFRWFEMLCYRNADAIIALSPGMQSAIKMKIDHPFVFSVTNSANIPLFSNLLPLPADFPFRPGTFALYSGNLGEVNQVMTLVDCAEELLKRGRSDLSIVLIGDGQLRHQVQVQKQERDIYNLHLLPLMPKIDLIPFVQSALASLVSLKGTPVLNTSSPNKLFESLASGVPVIQTTTGWLKGFVENEQVGLTVSANDPSAMADAIIYLHDNSELRIEMGQRAAEIAKQRFDKDILAEEMIRVFKLAIDNL